MRFFLQALVCLCNHEALSLWCPWATQTWNLRFGGDLSIGIRKKKIKKEKEKERLGTPKSSPRKEIFEFA